MEFSAKNKKESYDNLRLFHKYDSLSISMLSLYLFLFSGSRKSGFVFTTKIDEVVMFTGRQEKKTLVMLNDLAQHRLIDLKFGDNNLVIKINIHHRYARA